VDYRLCFTQRALKDLAEIIGHIAEDDVEAAARFGNSLVEHVDLLRQFPRMAGTIRGRSWVRKLVLARYWFTTKPTITGGWSKFSTSAMDSANHRGSERYLTFRRAGSSCAMMTP
jgi:plasmid stabilization system protein ParE